MYSPTEPNGGGKNLVPLSEGEWTSGIMTAGIHASGHQALQKCGNLFFTTASEIVINQKKSWRLCKPTPSHL
jgi:hypothetical protein